MAQVKLPNKQMKAEDYAVSKKKTPLSIKIEDERYLDPITNKPLKQENRKGYTVDSELVDDLVQRSYHAGVNPSTVLAMALQETGLGNAIEDGWSSKDNPLHLNESSGNYIENSFKLMQEKNRLANKLGKTDDASKIQAWNGYGKLSNPEGQDGSIYGINLNTLPNRTLDMNKNPVYGKTVVNLRDSIIAQNPKIQEIINKYKPEQIDNSPLLKAKKSAYYPNKIK